MKICPKKEGNQVLSPILRDSEGKPSVSPGMLDIFVNDGPPNIDLNALEKPPFEGLQLPERGKTPDFAPFPGAVRKRQRECRASIEK